jgi:aspartyl-tRNA(Asn)/glutamyl-tRNA(Gln) amidotransferase subunit C
MLSLEEIRRLARLARIELASAEAEALGRDMNDILAMVEQMSAIDTDGVEPMAHPQEMAQRLREDRVTETGERELFQSIAPQVEDGLYLVPKVIE